MAPSARCCLQLIPPMVAKTRQATAAAAAAPFSLPATASSSPAIAGQRSGWGRRDLCASWQPDESGRLTTTTTSRSGRPRLIHRPRTRGDHSSLSHLDSQPLPETAAASSWRRSLPVPAASLVAIGSKSGGCTTQKKIFPLEQLTGMTAAVRGARILGIASGPSNGAYYQQQVRGIKYDSSTARSNEVSAIIPTSEHCIPQVCMSVSHARSSQCARVYRSIIQ